MAKRYHVYGLGAALVDTEINVTNADLKNMNVEKGHMCLVDEIQLEKLTQYFSNSLSHTKRTSGGSTANAIVSIAQFGGRAFYCCKVGNDENGKFFLQELQKSRVDCHIDERHDEGVTGTCLVMITPDAERTLNTFLGANTQLSEADIIPEDIIASEYVYLETYALMSHTTAAAVARIFNIARKHEVKIALSFSDPGIVQKYREELSTILSSPIDLLFCNRKEAFAWAQTDSLEIAIDSLKRITRTFVITLGAEGALLFDGFNRHTIASHKVKAVNTNGAGDMFAGAFLYGITQGHNYSSAGRLASLAAATVVSDAGARLTISKQKQILAQWSNA